MTDADADDTAALWFWRADDASWNPFDDSDAVALESALRSGDDCAVLGRGGQTYVVDLAASPMVQRNLDTGFEREVRRGWPEPEGIGGGGGVAASSALVVSSRSASMPAAWGDEEDDEEEEDEEEEEEEEEADFGDDDDEEEEYVDSDGAIAVPGAVDENDDDDDDAETTAAAPDAFVCPLSLRIMTDPATTSAGSTYERGMIERWLRSKKRKRGRGRRRGYDDDDDAVDPLTNAQIDNRLIPNRALRDAIQQWRDGYEKKKRRRGKGAGESGSSDEFVVNTSAASAAASGLPVSSPVSAASAAAAATSPVSSGDVGSPQGGEGRGVDLAEGEEREVRDGTYKIKLIGGVYSCSCPAWRFAGGPIHLRTCKHLRAERGDDAEDRRVGEWTRQGAAKRQRHRGPPSGELRGKIVCFTGALSTMTRARASALAVGAGAAISKSVTRSTTVVVVGSRPGVKLSNADAGGIETWDEDRFLDAVGDRDDDVEDGDGSSGGRAGAFVGAGRGNTIGGGSAAGANSDEDSSVPLRIMLAQSFKQGNGVDPTGWLMSEKLDGMRAFWDGHAGKLWSRQGKMVHAPDWWLASLPRNMYLDGELWLGRGQFQACMRIARRRDRPQAWSQVRFLVFDAPDDRTVVGGQSRPNGVPEGYEERYKKAEAAIAAAAASLRSTSALASASSSSSASTPASGVVEMHPYEICRGDDHLERKLAEVEGLDGEGLMLRRAGSKYRAGRSPDLLKVKSSKDDEAVVLAHESGRGRHTGRVGALRVLNRSGKTFKVGTGLSDAERESPPPVGAVVTYRYNELTEGGVPRFPVFVRVRPDVDADDVRGAVGGG